MRTVLSALARWAEDGTPAAIASVVDVKRSAPRDPGAVMALSVDGEIAGSVTGGCVEPAVVEDAREVLAGGPPRVRQFGIVDEEAFEVGLPCGGDVTILIERMSPEAVLLARDAVAEERPVALVSELPDGDDQPGRTRAVFPDGPGERAVDARARSMLALGQTGVAEAGDERAFVNALAPRPAMYVFGAIDFAAALARLGRFMGYRVTVCDSRESFVTPERFPDVDDLVVEWPHEFLARAPVDPRTAICVLTHDAKFDVPALRAAVATDAGYIGAMGSRRTTARRAERLREEGVGEEDLARIHAPIGLSIGSSTPEEVAVSIGAQIIASAHAAVPSEAPQRV